MKSQHTTGDRPPQDQLQGALPSFSATRQLSARDPTSEPPASESRRLRSLQQEDDLHYYRTFLEDLVAVMRDGHTDAVAQIVSLIRSGASHDEIYRAIRRVQTK